MVSGLRLADGSYLPADVVLVAVGAIPNTEWLAGSGMELRDGVLCDSVGHTNAPGIVAVGDCAAWLDEESGRHGRLERWAGAAERPAIAVAVLLEPGSARPPLNVPYFWSDQYNVRIQLAGHVRDAERVEIVAGDPAAHLPNPTSATAQELQNDRRSLHAEPDPDPAGVHFMWMKPFFVPSRNGFFEQMWFCAVRSADLDKAGAWRTVQVGRESVLISRTRKGQIRGFYNICRHRGVKLCMEEQGEGARVLSQKGGASCETATAPPRKP